MDLISVFSTLVVLLSFVLIVLLPTDFFHRFLLRYFGEYREINKEQEIQQEQENVIEQGFSNGEDLSVQYGDGGESDSGEDRTLTSIDFFVDYGEEGETGDGQTGTGDEECSSDKEGRGCEYSESSGEEFFW